MRLLTVLEFDFDIGRFKCVHWVQPGPLYERETACGMRIVSGAERWVGMMPRDDDEITCAECRPYVLDFIAGSVAYALAVRISDT